ncbi:hypothetical protein PORCRE_1004 [Porphyromonas crevioricanis JCM 15906]|uniref:DUF3109 family protein n=2 Tax=Porphyromonas crevioricanis TaxID=393921 RepID=A0AB34PHZ3_9PORP|nr:DUF3109 family protein [Porphyromonas crevioricanis]KGN94981.1 hypothetical protein HQ38_04070 [Porphyromonas crevioricanis]GAD05304.1 hypothetical protein PORCRE_1004 [Porphyromonas crevioricanis JCM 15906]SJZ52226.1 Protein of unknown function [Porphyromonas crevioricanis]
MIYIGDKLVSLDIIDQQFVCDYDVCKGICCVEGDNGAPLAAGEADKIRALLPLLQDLISPQAKKLIEEEGISYIDEDGEEVTQIVNGKDCVFTTYDSKGRCQCAIERLYREGKTDFLKPISCHLYPIRVQKYYGGATALNYQQWSICKCAIKLGRKMGIPIYQFLKEPLIRAYGEEWYEELCLVAREYLAQKQSEQSI